MKKQRTSAEVTAEKVGRDRAWPIAIIGLVLGVLALTLSFEFIQLHCGIMVLLTVWAGYICARAILTIHPTSAGSTGRTAGMIVGFAYAIPFIIAAAQRWVNLDAAEVARRVGALTQPQVNMLAANNVIPNLDYFRAGEISYLFGYFIFGIFLGGLMGMIGGLLARRGSR